MKARLYKGPGGVVMLGDTLLAGFEWGLLNGKAHPDSTAAERFHD